MMKKRKLKQIAEHFEHIPLVNSSILYAALAETLAAHLFELYHGIVNFTYTTDSGITHVTCDVARLFVCLRLILDCADSEQPIRVHLSLDGEDGEAALSISMQSEIELPRKDLHAIGMLGHLRLYENDEGVSIRMQAKHEKVLHLFAMDAVSLRNLFRKIDRMMDELFDESNEDCK